MAINSEQQDEPLYLYQNGEKGKITKQALNYAFNWLVAAQTPKK